MNECYNIVVVVKVATAVRGGLDPRTAIEGSFSAWGGLGKPNCGRARGETDSGSDRDSGESPRFTALVLTHSPSYCIQCTVNTQKLLTTIIQNKINNKVES